MTWPIAVPPYSSSWIRSRPFIRPKSKRRWFSTSLGRHWSQTSSFTRRLCGSYFLGRFLSRSATWRGSGREKGRGERKLCWCWKRLASALLRWIRIFWQSVMEKEPGGDEEARVRVYVWFSSVGLIYWEIWDVERDFCSFSSEMTKEKIKEHRNRLKKSIYFRNSSHITPLLQNFMIANENYTSLTLFSVSLSFALSLSLIWSSCGTSKPRPASAGPYHMWITHSHPQTSL